MSQATEHAAQPAHTSHGHSIAAWVGVSVIMLGSLIWCTAVAVQSPLMFWGGWVVVALGPIAGKVLAAAGFGISGKPGA